MNLSHDERFYADLPLNTLGLAELMGEPGRFAPVPPDWHVVLTDVKGSTRALDDGMHHTVNLVATGSIVAALNIARKADIRVPFFFGGDGATMIVPASLAAPVLHALNLHSENTRRQFGLELRVGAVQVADILAAGRDLRVAKAKMSEDHTIPVVLGEGLQYAEKVVKGEDYMLAAPEEEDAALNLEGMQCRWDSIKPPGDAQEVVCLLVAFPDYARQSALCREVLAAIDTTFGPPHERNPVSVGRLQLQPTVARAVRELRARLGRYGAFDVADAWVRSVVAYAFLRWLPQGREYREGVTRLSDTLMLDGKISTVIAGTRGQRERLAAALDAMEAAGSLHYGMHVCSSSVMSCYVRDRRNDHIHFVDGMGGGYTRAATVLKAKLARG
ncbi:MAG: DUF3095 family protein [Betaproteobacteria bacterium]|nr:DUF3095 family protein [Betaproteobacteria bacterium]